MWRALSPLIASLLATLWVSAIALVGIVFLFTRRPGMRAETFLLSFAAGVLLATTFLELIPEAVERGHEHGNIFAAALVAMIGFFFLERVLLGFHVHDDSRAAASRYLILVGDSVHNFIDGVAIAASFFASPELGLATTVAVTVHEVPQEIADFSILIAGGFGFGTALVLNFVSGLTAILGALLFFALGGVVQPHLAWFMTATAGMFIYIAGSDLIPQVHHHRAAPGILVYLPFLGGVVIIAVLSAAMAH
jgi:zinc and cadmium transporter